jgi:hypothetical protein
MHHPGVSRRGIRALVLSSTASEVWRLRTIPHRGRLVGFADFGFRARPCGPPGTWGLRGFIPGVLDGIGIRLPQQ